MTFEIFDQSGERDMTCPKMGVPFGTVFFESLHFLKVYLKVYLCINKNMFNICELAILRIKVQFYSVCIYDLPITPQRTFSNFSVN